MTRDASLLGCLVDTMRLKQAGARRFKANAAKAKEAEERRVAERGASEIITLNISCLRSTFRKMPSHVLHLFSMFDRMPLKCCNDLGITRVEFLNFKSSAKIRHRSAKFDENMQKQLLLLKLSNVALNVACLVQEFFKMRLTLE